VILGLDGTRNHNINNRSKIADSRVHTQLPSATRVQGIVASVMCLGVVAIYQLSITKANWCGCYINNPRPVFSTTAERQRRCIFQTTPPPIFDWREQPEIEKKYRDKNRKMNYFRPIHVPNFLTLI
jgi:hypothetical protein